ncbi:hypothetical protein [Afifella pfennigii]|nr:hypothetical protein [Afifella pfennigii]
MRMMRSALKAMLRHRLYDEHVLQADEGCDFDFLRGTSQAVAADS